jgi:hypothetical protein
MIAAFTNKAAAVLREMAKKVTPLHEAAPSGMT